MPKADSAPPCFALTQLSLRIADAPRPFDIRPLFQPSIISLLIDTRYWTPYSPLDESTLPFPLPLPIAANLLNLSLLLRKSQGPCYLPLLEKCTSLKHLRITSALESLFAAIPTTLSTLTILDFEPNSNEAPELLAALKDNQSALAGLDKLVLEVVGGVEPSQIPGITRECGKKGIELVCAVGKGVYGESGVSLAWSYERS